MAGNFIQNSEQYLSQIDAEIERLQQLRTQVTGAIQGDKQVTESPQKARRGMSAEGRLRVAEAQKARWARQKSAAKTAAKGAVKAPAKGAVKAAAAKKPAAKKSAAVKKQPAAA